ncbi:MAG: HAD family hydrolase [Gammaproteobacteria bacterium]
MNGNTIIHALDFDGVICDSAVETAITGWKAAHRIWNEMPREVPQEAVDRFRKVRPIIETGYEAILAMRLLFLGDTVESIYSEFAGKSKALMQQAGVSADELKTLFGDIRDHWIDTDLRGWIEMNPLFDGIADKLKRLDPQTRWYVVTTKQERFVRHILKAHGIEQADDRIFGLDRRMSKTDVLKVLMLSHPEQLIYFVEDRLAALMNVLKDDQLKAIRLIFALWGYNTDADKVRALQLPLCRQKLEEFLMV